MRRERFVPAYKLRRLERERRPRSVGDVVVKFNAWAAASKVAFMDSPPGTGR